MASRIWKDGNSTAESNRHPSILPLPCAQHLVPDPAQDSFAAIFVSFSLHILESIRWDQLLSSAQKWLEWLCQRTRREFPWMWVDLRNTTFPSLWSRILWEYKASAMASKALSKEVARMLEAIWLGKKEAYPEEMLILQGLFVDIPWSRDSCRQSFWLDQRSACWVSVP